MHDKTNTVLVRVTLEDGAPPRWRCESGLELDPVLSGSPPMLLVEPSSGLPAFAWTRRRRQCATEDLAGAGSSYRFWLIATATMLELAPTWVHWHDAGARRLPMCVRGSPYDTLRSMPLVAEWR